MPKNWGYYHVDCGHFPSQIKLCFSNEMFQQVLRDHGITEKATALDEGIAETHYLTDGKHAVIIMAFDLAECVEEDPAFLAGVIAHEATHCVCRIFEHIGEAPDEIGEESRAYLTEHIVKQITTGINMEIQKNVRKADRAASKQKSEGAGRAKPKVDQHDNGSPRSDSVSEKSNTPGRAKNKNRRAVKKAAVSVRSISRVRTSGNRIEI
jgi:hypothetical protein